MHISHTPWPNRHSCDSLVQIRIEGPALCEDSLNALAEQQCQNAIVG